MAYELIYRGQFVNFEGQNVILHISDTTSGQIDPTTFHDLSLTSCELKVTSDGEDKTGIKGVRTTFSFLPTEEYNLMTFIPGEDDRYLVEIFIGSTSNIIFTGYLVLDSAKDKYLTPETYVVEMTASDNLGILKEISLTDFTGENPRGKFELIEYIAWSLEKTNLQLTIHVACNLFEENYNGLDHDPLSTIFLDTLTFEKQINESESCYEVLTKILLAWGCFLTQRNGDWWIIRVDEITDQQYRYYSYSYLGVYDAAATINPEKEIGKDLSLKLINRDAEILPEREKQYVQQTYKYNYGQELICNIDFSRGDFVPISVPGGAGYAIECWTAGRYNVAATATPYIRRLFTNGYETERVVVFPQTTMSNPANQHYIHSEPLYVNEGDKINFSVDSRFTTNVSGSSGTYRDRVAIIRLYGDDGTYWTITGQALTGEVPGQWIQSNASFNINMRELQHVWNITQEDETKWFSVDVESLPIPRAGYVVVYLHQSGLFGGQTETHFSNLSIEYIALVNGIYQKLTGHYHKVSQVADLRANVEDEVYINDALNPNFKGGLFRFNGTKYVRTGNWYNYLAGTSGELGLEKFGKYQAFALWNQNNRVIRKFTATVLGLNTSTPDDLPSLIHKFTFAADSDHTNDKIFQLVAYSFNLASCRWTGTFIDVYDTVLGKDFSADHLLKYTTK